MKTVLTLAVLAAVLTGALAARDERAAVPITLAPTVVASASPAPVRAGRHGFGFNGTASGFPTGAMFLTGGGSYDAASATNTLFSRTDVVSSGGFRCTADVAQSALAGCDAGEGVRWDTRQLLASAPFKCTVPDAVKTAVTDASTVVLLADFYRAGDGEDESFTAQMIVSENDLAPNIEGDQHLWVQGIGCGDAVVNFDR